MIKADIMAKVIDNEMKNYSFIVEESIKVETEVAKELEYEIISRLEEEYANTVLKAEEERIRANGDGVEYCYQVVCYKGTEVVYKDYGVYDTEWEAESHAEVVMKYERPDATNYFIRRVAVRYFDFQKQFDETLARVQKDWANMTQQQKNEAWGLISDLYKDLEGVRPHGMAAYWGLV